MSTAPPHQVAIDPKGNEFPLTVDPTSKSDNMAVDVPSDEAC